MAVGLGIHGEEGIAREALSPAAAVAKRLVDGLLCADEAYAYFAAARGDRVALLLNNLGGTSQLELLVMLHELLRELIDHRGICVERVYFGAHMTSLAMAGVSASLLRLDPELAGMPREIVRWVDVWWGCPFDLKNV